MRRPIPMLFCSLALSMLVACGGDDSHGPPTAAEAKAQELAQNAKATAQSAKELFLQKQNEYRRAAEEKLKELDPQIQALREKAKAAAGDAKVELDKLVAKLEQQRKDAADELARWKDVGSDAWQSFTSKVSQQLDALERAAQDATVK